MLRVALAALAGAGCVVAGCAPAGCGDRPAASPPPSAERGDPGALLPASLGARDPDPGAFARGASAGSRPAATEGAAASAAVPPGTCERARRCCPAYRETLAGAAVARREDPCRTLELAIQAGGGAADEACFGALELFGAALDRAGRERPEPCR